MWWCNGELCGGAVVSCVLFFYQWWNETVHSFSLVLSISFTKKIFIYFTLYFQNG